MTYETRDLSTIRTLAETYTHIGAVISRGQPELALDIARDIEAYTTLGTFYFTICRKPGVRLYIEFASETWENTYIDEASGDLYSVVTGLRFYYLTPKVGDTFFADEAVEAYTRLHEIALFVRHLEAEYRQTQSKVLVERKGRLALRTDAEALSAIKRLLLPHVQKAAPHMKVGAAKTYRLDTQDVPEGIYELVIEHGRKAKGFRVNVMADPFEAAYRSAVQTRTL